MKRTVVEMVWDPRYAEHAAQRLEADYARGRREPRAPEADSRPAPSRARLAAGRALLRLGERLLNPPRPTGASR